MENYIFRPKKDLWISNRDKMRKASYSQIDKAFSCGMAWYLRYIKKYPEDFSENLAQGSVYHYINEVLYLEAFNTKGESFNYEYDKLLTIANDALDKVFPEYFENKGLADAITIKAKSDIKSYIPVLIKHYKEHKLMPISFKDDQGKDIPAIEIAVECPIQLIDGSYRDDFYIYVKVDLVAKDKDGKIVVIDHKTAGKSYSETKIKINQQLPIYAYALGMLFDELNIPYSNTVRYDVITKTKDPSIKVYEKTVKAVNTVRALTFLNAGCNVISSKALSFCNSEMTCNMCNHKDRCIENDMPFDEFSSYISNNEIKEEPKESKEVIVEAVLATEEQQKEVKKQDDDFFEGLGF